MSVRSESRKIQTFDKDCRKPELLGAKCSKNNQSVTGHLPDVITHWITHVRQTSIIVHIFTWNWVD